MHQVYTQRTTGRNTDVNSDQPVCTQLKSGSDYTYTLGVFGVAPWPPAPPGPPLLANLNLFRNPNMVFESPYLVTANTKSLFPMAPEW